MMQKTENPANRQLITEENKEQIFEFEVFTVNAKGEITNTTWHQAQYQIEHLGNGVTLEIVFIPEGTFMMGSPETDKHCLDTEIPQHNVTVKPFYMGKYQITQAQWQAVMNSNPSHFKGENYPVEIVSYDDVIVFCERLSEKTGKTYRLPNEAEWEYACRAGTTTPFYFGETITTNLVNYSGEYTYASESQSFSRLTTTEVGSFPPNAFGLYDMHGNVWEWCADPWHENYVGAPTESCVWELEESKNLNLKTVDAKDISIPPGVDNLLSNTKIIYDEYGKAWKLCVGSDCESVKIEELEKCLARLTGQEKSKIPRVLRGGSFSNHPSNCCSAYRNWSLPDIRNDRRGFRIVKEI